MSRNPLFLRKENFFIFFKKVLAFSFFLCYYMQALERVRYALVAQLDRVTDYESVGRGFESLPAYQKSRYPFGYLLFCIYGERDSKDLIQVAFCRILQYTVSITTMEELQILSYLGHPLQNYPKLCDRK